MDQKRRGPYLWATWLASALSGDKHCEFAPWFKAHYTYDKRADAGSGDLVKWKADHAEAVRNRVFALEADNWLCTVEDQNKFNVKGATATVGGVADIVASRGTRGTEVRIEDVKTGKPRDSDYWQVLIYLAMFQTFDARVKAAAPLTGAVIYKESIRLIDGADVADELKRVYRRVKDLSASAEPPKTPSASECRFCDIGSCPSRVATTEAPATKTRLF